MNPFTFIDKPNILGRKSAWLDSASMGQTLSSEVQDAYYRKLSQYMEGASDIQKFYSDHPTVAKAFGLDQTALQIGSMVGGFSSLKWGGIAGSLRQGTATAIEVKEVDDLGALIVPAQQKLIEAQKVVASQPPSSSGSWLITTLLVGAGAVAVAEVVGLTNITGLRRRRR
jgi:hypothetical protein